AGGAQPQAPDPLDGDVAEAGGADGVHDALEDPVGRQRQAAGRHAHVGGTAHRAVRGETGGPPPGPALRGGVDRRLRRHSFSSAATASPVASRPSSSPSTIMTGARLQAPTQRAVRTDSFPSGVVWPGRTPNRPAMPSSSARAPLM